MGKLVSSIELFKKFQQRFRQIFWSSAGFITESSPQIVGGLILQNESLRLSPGFELGIPIPTEGYEKGGSYSHFWHRSWVEGEKECPFFNVRKGGLAFKFVFDPENDTGIKGQSEEAAMLAISDGPFRKRIFFMDPELANSDDKKSLLGEIGVRFSLEGEPIPGLELANAVASDWRFFFPEICREKEAIQAAIDLEGAKKRRRDYFLMDPEKARVAELTTILGETLIAVPDF